MTRLSRSPDLERLREDGYEVFIHRTGYLVLNNIPYVDSSCVVRRGRLVSELTVEADVTIQPRDHVVMWSGDAPCDRDGNPLSRYALVIAGPAAVFEPGATPMTFGYVETPDDDSVFEYVDTAATRARITALMDKFKSLRVVVAGCGGSGSYVLDFVAKTPVRQIDVYDGDRFRQHNAFRSPGAPRADELRGGPNKAEYFASKYRAMHRNVVAHPYALDESNVDELAGADFVFISIDRASAKVAIIKKLEDLGIQFVDVGMGVAEDESALGGLLRVTASIAGEPTLERGRFSIVDPDPDNDYRVNIQIADLNALNAALAVVRWKKSIGFYRDLGREHNAIYLLDDSEILNEDRT